MNIQDVKDLALKCYLKGGDSIYESWNDALIQQTIDAGINTPAKWRKQFKFEGNKKAFGNGGITYK